VKKFIFLLLFIFYQSTAFSINQFKYSKDSLRAEFCNTLYDNLNFPNLPNKTPLKIDTELLVEEINNVDGKSFSFDAVYTLWIYWTDDRVIELLKKLGKYEKTNEPTYLCDYEVSSIWGAKRKLFDPVVEIYNQKKTPKYSERFDWIEIFSNGTIQARVRASSDFRTKELDFSKFPFDKQTFSFHIFSEFPINFVEFIPNKKMNTHKKELYKADGEDGLNIPGWKVKDVNFKNIITKEDNYEYSGFVVEITAERNFGYYIFKIMIPVIFLIVITWSVFWIKVSELQAKVNVTVVTLLALIAYNFIFEQDIPKLSYVTYLDVFILFSYFFAGTATILCIYSHWKYLISKKDQNIVGYYARRFGPISYVLINLLAIFLYI
jgi:hypothetical protein